MRFDFGITEDLTPEAARERTRARVLQVDAGPTGESAAPSGADSVATDATSNPREQRLRSGTPARL